ncbi:MAG: endonuclease/exonuclease/phosphatase family protein [Verrucomicrobiota bacterium]|nr:endonuclease/exonuclease/phosphatase family protein [Verrucomicrobiota bacterium]
MKYALLLTLIILPKTTPVQAVDAQPSSNEHVSIKFAAYNVLFGLWGEPESIGQKLKKHNLDIICFNEVPNGNWTKRVGDILEMDHTFVGEISSANHKNKYKSILSRFPLLHTGEIEINEKGWKPASLVYASIKVKNIKIKVYSTHIPGQQNPNDSAASFIANNIIKNSNDENLLILGDLNNEPNKGALKTFYTANMKSIWNELGVEKSQNSTHKHIESGKESGIIDHIFYKSRTHKISVVNGGIIYDAFNNTEKDIDMPRYKKEWIKYDKPLSDHRPIWAELLFK